MSRLTSAQWRLSRDVIDLVTAEKALTEEQVAEQLGVSVAELHPVIGMLVGRKMVDRAGDYLVPVQPGRAA